MFKIGDKVRINPSEIDEETPWLQSDLGFGFVYRIEPQMVSVRWGKIKHIYVYNSFELQLDLLYYV